MSSLRKRVKTEMFAVGTNSLWPKDERVKQASTGNKDKVCECVCVRACVRACVQSGGHEKSKLPYSSQFLIIVVNCTGKDYTSS